MKNIIYLFIAAIIFAFTACGGGESVTEEATEAVVEEVVVEEPSLDLDSMTKVELEAVGREHGVELDRREKKSSLLSKIKKIVE